MSRLGDYFASQCGNPRGIMGRILTWSMNRANRVLYEGIVDELGISDDTSILDIGFGNGYLEKKIFEKGKCHITGIDISEDMVQKAIELNQVHVNKGNMVFKLGDCCDLDFNDRTFDVVATINTIYFWEDTMKGLSEIYRVLKQDGVFYNAVLPKENLDKLFYTKKGFKKFEIEEYISFGKEAGFEQIETKTLGNNYGMLVIYKKSA